eukprot:2855235-Rhodomonas_salina.1
MQELVSWGLCENNQYLGGSVLVLKFVNAGVYYTGVRIRGLTRAVKPYGGGESQRQTATFEVEILDSGRGPCLVQFPRNCTFPSLRPGSSGVENVQICRSSNQGKSRLKGVPLRGLTCTPS